MKDINISFMNYIMKVINTIKFMHLRQLVYCIICKYKISKSFDVDVKYEKQIKYYSLFISWLDADQAYVDRFDLYELINNKIVLLNNSGSLNYLSWSDLNKSHLWNFNLHYLEYCIALAIKFLNTQDDTYINKLTYILNKWINNGSKTIDAVHPYTISLRVVNLFIVNSIFNKDLQIIDLSIYECVYTQYIYLLSHQEKHLLGNHYFENLKTIVICSIIYDENDIYDIYIKKLLEQIQEQLLSDGVHFELSFMYHKIILEDIIRVAYVLKQAQKNEYAKLLPAIQNMTDVAYSIDYGIGRTPLFNDSGNNVAKSTSTLCKAVMEIFAIVPNFKDTFVDSGYYKLYDGENALLFDAGKIGPDYMPGHGHCDCLSFELSVGCKPLFVNSGTYQYQGALRNYFRSTRAHNTVMIGNREQSECWGEHRVARRISHVKAEKSGSAITASYKSYLGDTHERTLSLADNILRVMDSTQTKDQAVVHSYLHIAPKYTPVHMNNRVCVFEGTEKVCDISAFKCNVMLHTEGELTNFAPEFGLLQKASTLEFTWNSDNMQHGYSVNFATKMWGKSAND